MMVVVFLRFFISWRWNNTLRSCNSGFLRLLVITSFVENDSESFGWCRITRVPFPKFWQWSPSISLHTTKNTELFIIKMQNSETLAKVWDFFHDRRYYQRKGLWNHHIETYKMWNYSKKEKGIVLTVAIVDIRTEDVEFDKRRCPKSRKGENLIMMMMMMMIWGKERWKGNIEEKEEERREEVVVENKTNLLFSYSHLSSFPRLSQQKYLNLISQLKLK